MGGLVQHRREERNTQLERKGEGITIFVPHRPQKQTGRQLKTGDIEHTTNLLGLQSHLETPDVVRRQRENSDNNQIGLGGSEYVSRHGTPLYILRKRNPLYGRKKRDTKDTLRAAAQGWVLLDPNTGRPLGRSAQFSDSGIGPVLRLVRNPETQLQNIEEFTEGQNTREHSSSSDSTQQYDYKYSRRNPYGGRKRREVIDGGLAHTYRILSRVARSPQRGWVLLDPSTGRPIEQDQAELPPNLRTPRKLGLLSSGSQDTHTNLRTFQNSAGVTQPLYKYYKKYPFGYTG